MTEGDILKQVGLVLEGGGMRGLYTSGVLDFFMDKNLYFPYIVAVSAGASNSLSYLSRQKGRTRDVNLDYINDYRYCSFRNLIKNKQIFGLDFIFDEIPKKLNIFDYDTFYKAKEKLVVGATDCMTGKQVYFEKNKCEDFLTAIKASCSLPFVSKPVKYDGKILFDGGITDSIPVMKSIKDGNTKNVIVLTRNKEYRKKPFKLKTATRTMYSKFPKLCEAILNRYKMYNETLDYINTLEKEEKAFVIRPLNPVDVKRVEKDTNKLRLLYEEGYKDAENLYDKMIEFINK